MKLKVFTDGASRGNPGPASVGFVIKDSSTGVILHEKGEVIGRNTNNVAEYTAVLKAFEYIKKYLRRGKKDLQIEVITDSQLIAKQLSGLFKIKNPNLGRLFGQVKSLEMELGIVSYKNVPRAQNTLADRLANQALDRE